MLYAVYEYYMGIIMNKELLIAGVLISISTALKICSVVALCQIQVHRQEIEHVHHESGIVVAHNKKDRTNLHHR